MKKTISSLIVCPIIFALVLSALAGCDTPRSLDSSEYQKDGFVMQLPTGWEVVQDYYISPKRRDINILTSVSSTVSIKVFDKRGADQTLKQYVEEYLNVALLEDLKNDAKVEYGDVTRAQGNGYFVEVLDTQEDYYIEIIEMKYENHLSFVTLHTPMKSKESVLNEFNFLIENINE
ncbi:hypothetical protein EZV61_13650 [Corallincola luteus]|uniref:PsbP C-terminal domain-containing protein n=1 Tax=Corallincola luteus TaxID=1775177 RepID=A0ABY2AK40_9GAMM|nr:hypothetical protein [Corallincola luteus]TCI02397.1 hypothetical protein EZV61_13650 [Corallincola luteus]